MTLASVFARSLHQQRLRKNMSQEALAAKAGISVSYVSMLEREQRSPPLETVERIAKALSVEPVSLLGGTARKR